MESLVPDNTQILGYLVSIVVTSSFHCVARLMIDHTSYMWKIGYHAVPYNYNKPLAKN